MNIVFFYPYNLNPLGVNGGGGTATIGLAEALAKRGHKILIAAQCISDELVLQNVIYVPLEKAYTMQYDEVDVFVAVVFNNIIDQLKKVRLLPDIIKVFSYHNSEVDHSDRALRQYFQNWADIVICVSEHSRQSLINWPISAEKIKVVQNGINSIFFDTPFDNMVRNPRQILFVGAIVPHKGVHLLINAFTRAQNVIKDLKLIVVGSSYLWGQNDYLDMEEICLKNKSIIYVGESKHSDLVKFYSESSILVLPSQMESFGLVAVEAMSRGCVPLVSKVGGMVELISEGINGFFIENPENLEEFSKKLVDVCGYQNLEQGIRVKAREKAKQFTWDTSYKIFLSEMLKDITKVKEKPGQVIFNRLSDLVKWIFRL